MVPTVLRVTAFGSKGCAPKYGPVASVSAPEYVVPPPSSADAVYHLGWPSGPYTKRDAKRVEPWWKTLMPHPDSSGLIHKPVASIGCGVARAGIASEAISAARNERSDMGKVSDRQTFPGLRQLRFMRPSDHAASRETKPARAILNRDRPRRPSIAARAAGGGGRDRIRGTARARRNRST